jgi:hypothetical protein
MVRGTKSRKIFDYDKDREDSAEWINILFIKGDGGSEAT